MTRSLPFIGAALVVLALAGCASPAPQTSAVGASALAELGDLTLVESKAPTQLLRNEAAARVPEVVVQDVADLADASVSCLSADVDPDGLARQWQSTATFVVTNSQAARVITVSDALAASFVDQGWTPDTVDGATVLSSEASPVTIAITAVEKASGMHAEIRITTTGPCVRTDGPESDEVVRLETGV